jgi:GNAT superfamily N-acetyltransferase
LWLHLLDLAEDYQPNSARWLELQKDTFISSHTIIAVDKDEIIGFMRFSVRAILNAQGEILERDGDDLLEAFGEALGVKPDRRNEGVGRALQETSFEMAKDEGCYQFRSALYQGAEALQHIKISMGCGVHAERDMTFFIKVL